MKIYVTPSITSKVKEICDITTKRKRFDWHYLYVVSTLRMIPLMDRRIQKEDFVSLNMDLLERLISKQEATTIINNLIDNGIIETDNIVIRGEKSRGYRFTEAYKNCKWTLTDIKDIKLSEKLDKNIITMSSEIDKCGRGYKIVNFWLNELQINVPKAKRFIKSMENLTDKEFESYESSVELLGKRQYHRLVDKTAGRFHTNLTNITTPLRQFLSIDGQELWGTDLTSSQPVFMAIIMRNIATVDKVELEKFTEVVCSGLFYEYIAEKAGLDLDLNDYKIRKEFKKKVFSGALFDRNRKDYSKWEKIFSESFPTILKAAREIKKKDHNRFAIMLQKEEAKFFFKCIEKCDDILGKGKVPMLSIHDSIVSHKEHIDIIQQVLEQEFTKQFGLSPKLKTEKL
jgi:hypothetical protein